MRLPVLEAICEAIQKTSGYDIPDSALYAARNPGGLVAYSPVQAKNDDGQRVFNSLLDGFQALRYDAQLKLAGQSRAQLKPDQTLTDFAAAYGYPFAAQAWAKFLRRALHDDSINHKTKIEYFLIGDKQ